MYDEDDGDAILWGGDEGGVVMFTGEDCMSSSRLDDDINNYHYLLSNIVITFIIFLLILFPLDPLTTSFVLSKARLEALAKQVAEANLAILGSLQDCGEALQVSCDSWVEIFS